MKRTKTFLYAFVILILVGFLSCNDNDNEDGCAECGGAISHYNTKLADNACNPDFMENAVNNMKDACGEKTAILAAYIMAESCCIGKNNVVNCTGIAEGISPVSTTLILSVENPISNPLADTVKVRLKKRGNIADSVMLEPNEFRVFLEQRFTETEKITIEILDEQDNLLYEETVPFTFIRPGKACRIRSIKVLELNAGEYDVDFVNWE